MTYYAIKWRGTTSTEVGKQSPDFADLEQARRWVGGSQSYVIRRRTADGWETVEAAGVYE